MATNADRFSGRVAEYERYRLRYPAEVIGLLQERCDLRPEDLVADIGAGTGMVAELFLGAGNRVIAVEPNVEMRAACERLSGRYPLLQVVDASAESTGLRAGSVDLVSVGRAFQWFDRNKALAEFKRVLKPGGWILLLTNRPAYGASQEMQEYEMILSEHGVDHVAKRGDLRSFDGLQPYGNAGTFTIKLPGKQSLSLEELLGQTQSYSIAPLPGHPKYAGMQKALQDFFARWCHDEVLLLDTACEVIGWRTPK